MVAMPGSTIARNTDRLMVVFDGFNTHCTVKYVSPARFDLPAKAKRADRTEVFMDRSLKWMMGSNHWRNQHAQRRIRCQGQSRGCAGSSWALLAYVNGFICPLIVERPGGVG
jgi:hypothetical protein